MRIAVFSDVHGNLEALSAVLQAARRHGPDAYLCLGDVVGYGANPKECIDLLRGLGIATLAGNHDYVAAGLLSSSTFNEFARIAIEWTSAQLDDAARAYLAGLPLVSNDGCFSAVHATLVEPEAFAYVDSPTTARLLLDHQGVSACLYGHSHIPVSYLLRDGALHITFDREINLGEVDRALVNVGSVGQPRDENPLACFVLVDTETRLLTLHRVSYDVDQAARKIIMAGLPPILGDRLLFGI
ncbi:MAG: metallophosphoesterase [Planctomycetota bacterium]